MTSRGGWTLWRAAALSCGVIAALAGCSAGGHPSAPVQPAATAAAQPAGGTSRAPAQDATAVAPLTGQAVTPAVAQRPAVAVAVSGPNPAAAVALALLAEPAARLLVGRPGHAGASPAEVATELRYLAAALPFAALLDTLLGATRGFRAMGPTVLVDRIGRPVLQSRCVSGGSPRRGGWPRWPRSPSSGSTSCWSR